VGQKILEYFYEFYKMLQRKVSLIGEFFHCLKLTHVFQKHPVYNFCIETFFKRGITTFDALVRENFPLVKNSALYTC
jgi:hypothetical protein